MNDLFLTELLDPRTLAPHPQNTGLHPERQVAAIRKSLEDFGWLMPPIWNRRTGRIIDGHARIEEAKSQEWPLVPVRVVDVDADTELRMLAVIHRTTELREVNSAQLAEVLRELEATPEGLPAGYDAAEAQELFARIDAENAFIPIGIPADESPLPDPEIETNVPALAAPGDLWQLGAHRLYCGSSTDPSAIIGLLAGGEVDLVFTDPPYGVSSKWGTGKLGKVSGKQWMENDDLTGERLYAFLKSAFELIPLVPDGQIYVCMQHTAGAFIGRAFEEMGWNWRHSIAWRKNVFGLSGRKGYRHQWEQIAFLTVGDNYVWFGDNSQSDVWDYPRPSGDDKPDGHPTPKPVALVQRALSNSSAPGETVFDGFAGVGSTLIACEASGRIARAIELRPDYCDIIIDRWQHATGKEAVKL